MLRSRGADRDAISQIPSANSGFGDSVRGFGDGVPSYERSIGFPYAVALTARLVCQQGGHVRVGSCAHAGSFEIIFRFPACIMNDAVAVQAGVQSALDEPGLLAQESFYVGADLLQRFRLGSGFDFEIDDHDVRVVGCHGVVSLLSKRFK